MTPPDPARRRTLLLLGSGLTLLAGCGDTDSTTPEPAPPPTTGTPEQETGGPGPGEETPAGTETPARGTGTPAPEDVVFSKPEGGEVSATIYGSGECGVVLVPQIDMDRQSWDPYGRQLAANDYLAMAIDEGEERKAAGVAGSVQYLREQRDAETVVVAGASSGGTAAIQASADAPDAVDGLVAISPSNAADRASDLAMPTLFVVSEGDDDQYVRTAETLTEEAAGESTLVTYEGEARGQHLFDSPHADALRSRIEEFLGSVCEAGNA